MVRPGGADRDLGGQAIPTRPRAGIRLYVFAYCVGRLVFELVRIDNATLIFGVRVNVFTSILVAIAAAIYFVISAIKRPGREASVYREPTDREPQPVPV